MRSDDVMINLTTGMMWERRYDSAHTVMPRGDHGGLMIRVDVHVRWHAIVSPRQESRALVRTEM